MKTAKIIVYSNTWRAQLQTMLADMAYELFGSRMCDVDKFVKEHTFIYLAVDGDKLVGVSSFIVNEYFGLKEPSIGNTYIYVAPRYRKTKVFYLFALQSGIISLELNLPLEHYYSNDGSDGIGRKLFPKGKTMYRAISYSVDEVEPVLDILKSKLKIKDR